MHARFRLVYIWAMHACEEHRPMQTVGEFTLRKGRRLFLAWLEVGRRSLLQLLLIVDFRVMPWSIHHQMTDFIMFPIISNLLLLKLFDNGAKQKKNRSHHQMLHFWFFSVVEWWVKRGVSFNGNIKLKNAAAYVGFFLVPKTYKVLCMSMTTTFDS